MLNSVHDGLLTSTLPENCIHHIQHPMLLKYFEGRLVDGLDILQIFLVQIIHPQHVLVFHLHKHLDILCCRSSATDSATLKAILFRVGHPWVKDAQATPMATKATTQIDFQCTPRAHASELPILKLRLANRRALQQVFILKIRNGKLVAFSQSNPTSKHKSILVAIRPAASGIAGMCTHRYSVVEDKAILFVVPEGIVAPSRHKTLKVFGIDR
mmetsp:Transcript_98758/g.175827  ORF Transcript_98758/g.175827 Transcript_98758/m.175827 type:complete len:213 (-) Transcript_98758:700-1338(-)